MTVCSDPVLYQSKAARSESHGSVSVVGVFYASSVCSFLVLVLRSRRSAVGAVPVVRDKGEEGDNWWRKGHRSVGN